MFHFRTFILRSRRQIVERFGSSSIDVLLKHPEYCFIDINDTGEMLHVRDTGRHDRLNLAVTVSSMGNMLIHYDSYGMGIWGSYIDAAYEFLTKGSGEAQFGIEPLLLSMKSETPGKIQVSLGYEEKFIKHQKFFFEAPAVDFIHHLVEAGNDYFRKMEEYGFQIYDHPTVAKLDKIRCGLV